MNILRNHRVSNMVRTNDKYLVLGYFNRGNLGDEAYIQAYKIIFPNNNLVFASIEDLEQVPDDVSVVIIAGGDVINPYFIPKIKRVLKEWGGPCYAFSVGIPFEADAEYVKLFDKIIVRSREDLPLAIRYLGKANVYFLEDITWVLRVLVPPITFKLPSSKHFKSIVIALAQPAFYNNPHEEALIDSFVSFIYELICKYPNMKVNLVSFNTHISTSESDHVINTKIYNKLSAYENVVYCNQNALRDPIMMMKFIQKQDLIIGMRLHSILFSMIQNVPFVAVYCTRKVGNLIKDFSQEDFAYALPIDEKCQPRFMDAQHLLGLVGKRLYSHNVQYKCDVNKFSLIRDICENKPLKKVLKHQLQEETKITADTIVSKTKQLIKQFLEVDDELMEAWERKRLSTNRLLEIAKKDTIDLARMICYSITNKIGSPYIWGLTDNMHNNQNFQLQDSIKWIYHDHQKSQYEKIEEEDYCPSIQTKRSIIIDVTYMEQDVYKGLHRSGWSYVISGLQQLDASVLYREARIKVDTCLERTFLWGLDIAKTQNIVPYTKPWAGIIHHTFENNYSDYNCHTLLKTKEFIDSLPQCRALFTLSYHLMYQLKDALREYGHPNISVYTLTHPTEFVSNTFTITKFLRNRSRKVIHIGAWLRNPFAIRSLQIPKDNKLGLSKCALKGKEMSSYFPPLGLYEDIVQHCVEKEKGVEIPQYVSIPHISRTPTICTPSSSSSSSSSSFSSSSSSSSSFHTVYSNTRMIQIPKMNNKYVQSMLEHLVDLEESVQVLEYIDNEEYDDLLSKNIVFLNLIDVSASNTVIECIVRNTPIIVNYHPALVEALGPNYPGFYKNLYEAASFAMDINKITQITDYLSRLDKKKFSLDYFLTEFQCKLLQSLR